MKYLFFICVLFSLICAGCATLTVQTSFKDPSFNIAQLNNAKIAVGCLNDVQLENYVKTFNKKYGTSQVYADDISDSLSALLQKGLVNSSCSKTDVSMLSNGLASDNVQQKADFWNHNTSDYLVIVKQTRINAEFVTTGGYGPGSAPSRTEYCNVAMDVDIWKVQEQKKLYSFSVKDKATVVFFTYTDALTKASAKTLNGIVQNLTKIDKNSAR